MRGASRCIHVVLMRLILLVLLAAPRACEAFVSPPTCVRGGRADARLSTRIFSSAAAGDEVSPQPPSHQGSERPKKKSRLPTRACARSQSMRVPSVVSPAPAEDSERSTVRRLLRRDGLLAPLAGMSGSLRRGVVYLVHGAVESAVRAWRWACAPIEPAAEYHESQFEP